MIISLPSPLYLVTFKNISEVISEAWKIDPGLFRKAKDKLPNENHG
jgi:hypothetical protein